MAMKAKHAFGSLADVEKALQAGKIDNHDILFLDGDTEPKVGWIDANGNFRLVKNEADFSELEELIATKANASDVETLEGQIATKANASDVEALEGQIAKKVDADTVQSMIEEHSESAIEVVEF